MGEKPLGKKSYGSIGHLPLSRLGSGDHKVAEGQAKIATLKKRDRHDIIIVQEKLDGSNVGVALIDDEIYPLTRAGYVANTSQYNQHHVFYNWVFENEKRFREVLNEGERLCGEWLYMAHGTKYDLPHEYFVAFDIFDTDNKRLSYSDFCDRLDNNFIKPYLISYGDSLSIDDAMASLGTYGRHGALEPIEGAMWRVERKGKVDFLCKYVRPDKQDGIYLDNEIVNTAKF